MAARLNKRQAENTKAAIQTGLIVKRLQDHVLGKAEMKPSQVTAGLGLLKKRIPDLGVMQHTGDAERPIVTKAIVELVGGNPRTDS
jgi:hypothetical protein